MHSTLLQSLSHSLCCGSYKKAKVAQARSFCEGEKVDPGGPMCSPDAGLAFLPHSDHPSRKDGTGNWGDQKPWDWDLGAENTGGSCPALHPGDQASPRGACGRARGRQNPRAAASATEEPLKGVQQKTVVERGGEHRARGQPGEFTWEGPTSKELEGRDCTLASWPLSHRERQAGLPTAPHGSCSGAALQLIIRPAPRGTKCLLFSNSPCCRLPYPWLKHALKAQWPRERDWRETPAPVPLLCSSSCPQTPSSLKNPSSSMPWGLETAFLPSPPWCKPTALRR